jgi:hypothetical protein
LEVIEIHHEEEQQIASQITELIASGEATVEEVQELRDQQNQLEDEHRDG